MRPTSGTNCFSALRTASATVPSLTRYRRITACMSPPVCLVIPSASPAPMAGRSRYACRYRVVGRVTWSLPKSAATLPQTEPRLGSKRGAACEGTVAAAPHPVKDRVWGAASAFADDEVLRVRPEAGGVGDLDRAGNRAVGRGRDGERARVLARDEGGDRFLLIVDHALEVLNRRGEIVFQAVGERGEFPHPLLGLLQLRLDLPHPCRDVADLRDHRVARRPQPRLRRSHLHPLGRNGDGRELLADLAHQTRVFGDFLHQALFLGGRLRQAVHPRLHLGGRALLAPCGDEQREGEPHRPRRQTAILEHVLETSYLNLGDVGHTAAGGEHPVGDGDSYPAGRDVVSPQHAVFPQSTTNPTSRAQRWTSPSLGLASGRRPPRNPPLVSRPTSCRAGCSSGCWASFT